jgi:hypothetical protein
MRYSLTGPVPHISLAFSTGSCSLENFRDIDFHLSLWFYSLSLISPSFPPDPTVSVSVSFGPVLSVSLLHKSSEPIRFTILLIPDTHIGLISLTNPLIRACIRTSVLVCRYIFRVSRLHNPCSTGILLYTTFTFEVPEHQSYIIIISARLYSITLYTRSTVASLDCVIS